MKFNCSNPGCRQRLEVDDALHGIELSCPACGMPMRSPSCRDIRLTCRRRECQQRMIVDVSEAGRVVRCPGCGRPARVPGNPPRLYIQRTTHTARLEPDAVPVVSAFARRPAIRRVLAAWGIGVALLAMLAVAAQGNRPAATETMREAMAADVPGCCSSGTRKGGDGGDAPCREVRVVEDVATNLSGRVFDFFHIAPSGVQPGVKYPVVVDLTASIRNRRLHDVAVLVRAGIGYVSPSPYGVMAWDAVPEDAAVWAVMNALGRFDWVDTDRLYVMGQSATVGAAVALLCARPARWRGGVLLEPGSALPIVPFARGARPEVFISRGRDDVFNEGPLGRPGVAETFFLEACARRLRVRLDYQEGGHGYAPEQLRRAYGAAAQFIHSSD